MVSRASGALALLCLLLALPGVSEAANGVDTVAFPGGERQWKYLVAQSGEDSTRQVVPLRPGLTLRYEGGSLVAEDSAFSARSITHRQTSSLRLDLTPPHEAYAPASVPVRIFRGAKVVADTVVGASGMILFEDLDPGEYAVAVEARRLGLEMDTLYLDHVLDDSFSASLDEFLVVPSGIRQDTVEFRAPSVDFGAAFSWTDDSLPYTYLLSMDGSDPVEASGCAFRFEGLEAGRHMLTVSGLTPLGTVTDGCSLPFTLIYPASDFEVDVYVANELEMPVEGITVRLSGKTGGERFETVLGADAEGRVVFADVPPGRYSVGVADPAFPFVAVSEEGVAHGYADGIVLPLEEVVGMPADLVWSLAPTGEDLCMVSLRWEVSGPEESLLSDYRFAVSVDDAYVGVTRDRQFEFELSGSGERTVGVRALTPYGNASEPAVASVDLSTAAVGLAAPDGEGWMYFDIGGRCLGAVVPDSPGVYVRSSGRMSEKFVVK